MVQQHMSGSVLTLTLTAGVVYCHSTDGADTLTESILTLTIKLQHQKILHKKITCHKCQEPPPQIAPRYLLHYAQ